MLKKYAQKLLETRLKHKPDAILTRTTFEQSVESQKPNANKLSLMQGIKQRDNVLPVSAHLESNTKKIGYWQPNQITSKYYSDGTEISEMNKTIKMRERSVRIFRPDDNHMQCTPTMPLGH